MKVEGKEGCPMLLVLFNIYIDTAWKNGKAN
jgi:hypothetical protein